MDWERAPADLKLVKGFVFRQCEEFSFAGGNVKHNQFGKYFVSFLKCQTHSSHPLPSSAVHSPKVKACVHYKVWTCIVNGCFICKDHKVGAAQMMCTGGVIE